MFSALHWFVLNMSCQVLAYFVSWSMSCWSCTLSLAALRGVYIFVSSANIWTKMLIALSKSLQTGVVPRRYLGGYRSVHETCWIASRRRWPAVFFLTEIGAFNGAHCRQLRSHVVWSEGVDETQCRMPWWSLDRWCRHLLLYQLPASMNLVPLVGL